MWLLREAMPTFNKNPEGGVFIVTSSVAGTSLSGSSMAYSVTKSAQLHLLKCLAKTQGKNVRVNAVLPGLLLTEWGLKYSEQMIAGIKDAAVLKKETDMDDCANIYPMIAENSSMTGQTIQVGMLTHYHLVAIFRTSSLSICTNMSRRWSERSSEMMMGGITMGSSLVRTSSKIEYGPWLWWPKLLHNGWIEDVRCSFPCRLFDLFRYSIRTRSGWGVAAFRIEIAPDEE